MPEKSYIICLDELTYIVVEFITVDGRVVSFVVRLMRKFNEIEKCIARYDTAHGCPHLDLVDEKGRLLEKKWLLEMNLAEALRFAVEDFKDNFSSYVQSFKS